MRSSSPGTVVAGRPDTASDVTWRDRPRSMKKSRNLAGCHRGAAARRLALEAVEPHRIVPQDLPLLDLGEPLDLQELLDRVRELAVGVRIVAAERDAALAERLDDVHGVALVDLGRDVALAPEVLARLHAQIRSVERAEVALEVLVHALEPPGRPAGTRLEEHDPQPRMPFEDAAHDQVHARAHVLDRVAHHVQLEELVVAAVA